MIYILIIFQKCYVLTSFRFREKGSLIEGYKKVAQGLGGGEKHVSNL